MSSISSDRRSSIRASATRRGCGLAAALVLGCIAVAAAADEPAPSPPVAVGTRVRLSAAGITTAPVIGTIRALDAKTVTIDVPGQAEPLAVPVERIRALEVSLGRRSRVTGALVGALLGAAVGALIGKASHSNGAYDFQSADEAAGALGGLLIGAGVGALIPPGERWQEAPGSRYRVSFAPRLDRTPGVAFALSF